MPPKPKLHKTTGKSTIAPQSTSSAPPVAIDPEVLQQFEVELCWCIQQLQNALNSGKLNQKQIQENTKVLNSLMSNSAPLIKKRQLMRLTFGDYRAKMAEEDKKLTRAVTNIKISPALPSKKSVFVKKSLFSSSGNTFRFNFPQQETENNLANEMSKVEIAPDPNSALKTEESPRFITSDNSFRFNFPVGNS